MNRRGFLGTLLVAPVAAVAAVTKTPPGDTLYRLPNVMPRPQRELSVARYEWSSFHDGFGLSDDEWEPVQLDLFSEKGGFTQEQLSYAGKIALEYFLKSHDPAQPLLAKLVT